eukprot:332728_1
MKFGTPKHYEHNYINEMSSVYNVVNVETENRIYLFGIYSNQTLTNIWYINSNESNYKLNKYKIKHGEARQNTYHFKYKSIECILCFCHMILIFIDTGEQRIGKDDDDEVNYDVVYCLDLKQNKLAKLEKLLFEIKKDIIVTKDNILHLYQIILIQQ